MKRWLPVLLAVVTVGVLATAATGAIGAEEGGGPTAKGGCSLGSQWSLHMGIEVGVEFEVEINSGVPGQIWQVELRYNRHTLVRTTKETEEDGGVRGLGLVEGRSLRLREGRVPRMGWARVGDRGTFYFAHSYAVETPHAISWSEGIAAEVRHGSFLGCQFHPEKSGAAGAVYLEEVVASLSLA